MENYKYISEQKKPFFSVGKALIYLIILLANLFFWSSDVFAKNYYANIYECQRDSDGYGISINYTSTPEIISGSLTNTQTKLRLYKFKTSIESYKASAACLLSDEPIETPKPHVVVSCNYGDSIEEMLPSVSGDWSEGVFNYSSVDYKFRIETETDIKYACDILHRYDVKCWEGNLAAAAQFRVDLIKDYPKYLVGTQLAYQGCLYDALLTADLDNKWDGECYNATFYRTDTPADQIGNVDFTPYACEEKTCPSDQYLDSQGICQYNQPSCPSGQFPQNGVCVPNLGNSKKYYIHDCTKYVTTTYNDENEYDKYWNVQTGVSCPDSVFSSPSGIEQYIRGHALTKFPFKLSFSTRHTSNLKYSPGKIVTLSSPNQHGVYANIVRAVLTIKFVCQNGNEVDNYESCFKVCPSGVEIHQDLDCNTTIQSCPDGSEIPINQNCSTKICSDGSEIPFDYSCPTSDGGTNGSGDSVFFQSEYEKFQTHLKSEANPMKRFDDYIGDDKYVGFYKVSYPNGFDGVFEEHMKIFEESEINRYLEKWKTPVGGTIELSQLYQFCFNMEPIFDLGCKSVPIDNRVWTFLRIILIFSTLIVARQITLGA